MPYTIENVQESTTGEMVSYLKRHEERSLFLLGNFEAYGFKMGDAPYSGNFKLIRDDSKVIGVFSLSKQGNLILQSDVGEPLFEMILKACKDEPVPLTGLLGSFELTAPLWSYLKENGMIQKETYTSREILYSLPLDQVQIQPQSEARLLNAADFALWKPLRLAYIKELGFGCNLTDDEMRDHFLWKTSQKISWGLFENNNLVAIADLNAKALDLGQLGGVYTEPAYRKRGLASRLLKKLVCDAKELHAIRKLVIFTNVENQNARRVYESLPVKQLGHYGIHFGKPK